MRIYILIYLADGVDSFFIKYFSFSHCCNLLKFIKTGGIVF